MIQCFFLALGVIIGGAFIGSIGAFASGEPPLTSIARIAKSLRIWAIVAAIGGTFDVISNFERGIMEGSTIDIRSEERRGGEEGRWTERRVKRGRTRIERRRNE